MFVNCRNCRLWTRPPETAPKPVGHCRFDGNPSHAGATCHRVQVTRPVATRMLGISAGEIRWLQSNPNARYATILRDAVTRFADNPIDMAIVQACFEQVEAWRQQRDYPRLSPETA